MHSVCLESFNHDFAQRAVPTNTHTPGLYVYSPVTCAFVRVRMLSPTEIRHRWAPSNAGASLVQGLLFVGRCQYAAICCYCLHWCLLSNPLTVTSVTVWPSLVNPRIVTCQSSSDSLILISRAGPMQLKRLCPVARTDWSKSIVAINELVNYKYDSERWSISFKVFSRCSTSWVSCE